MSTKYAREDESAFDEEEVTVGRSVDAGEEPRKHGQEIVYDDEEYLAEVGEMNCYCVPTRVYGFKDFFLRTVGWTLLNKEQILGAWTGEFEISAKESMLFYVYV